MAKKNKPQVCIAVVADKLGQIRCQESIAQRDRIPSPTQAMRN